MSEDQGGPEGLIPEVLPGPAVEPPDGEQAKNGDEPPLQGVLRSLKSREILSSLGLSWLGVDSIFWLTQSVRVCRNG